MSFGQLQLPAPFHINLSVCIDQDVGYAWIRQQGFKRPQAEYFILDITDDTLALCLIDWNVVFNQQPFHQVLDFDQQTFRWHTFHHRQIHPVEQLLMYARLQFLIRWNIVQDCEREGVLLSSSSLPYAL